MEREMAMGRRIRMITKEGSIVACGVDSTDMVGEAERIHKTSAVVTAALGRLLTGASLMGSMLKGEKDTITLRINGGGPCGTLLCVADSTGNAKGYPQNPVVELPLNEKGKLDVGGAVGRDGRLAVIRDTGVGEPYVGQCPLVSGEIAEDITGYYGASEQVPTVCALGVLVNPDLTVNCAGGLLIQLLPFAPEADVAQLEQNIQGLPSITRMLSKGMTIDDICRRALDGFETDLLDEAEVSYQCDCSRRRVEKALLTLKEEDLAGLADDSGKAEVCCQFCDRKYYFTKDELKDLAARGGE